MVAPVTVELSQAATRQSLLEAACEVFAEVGFRSATVREICQRAGANIAAVNYHFGDKERLYLEALRFAQGCAAEKYPTDLGVSQDAAPEVKLRAFVRSFLLRIFDEGQIAWYGKIMAREMIEPTAALDALIEEKFRPQATQLTHIIRDILGSEATPETVRLSTFSVVSQCCFYHHCRPVVSRLFPQQKFSPSEIEKLADHITQFSISALKQMARTKAK